jgi:hypothetical protein
MFCRVSAAVAAAAIAAMLLVPAQSSARGGAGMGGHGGGFHPRVRPTHPVHLPFVHRHDPLFAHRKFRERHPFEHRHHRRNDDGFVGNGYGGYGYGGGGYGGNGYGDNGYADNGYSDNGYGYGDYGYCNYGFGYRSPLTCGDYSVFYGRYYDPSDMTGSIWVPPYTVRPASVMSIAGRLDPPINRGGCRSETVPVPSPGGAESSVTITRC